MFPVEMCKYRELKWWRVVEQVNICRAMCCRALYVDRLCVQYFSCWLFGVWFGEIVPALYRCSNPKTLLLYLLFTTKNTYRVMNRHMPENMEAKKKHNTEHS